MSVLVLASLSLNAFLTVHNGFRAGNITLENYWVVDVFFSKPWTKLFATAFGLILCKFYHSVLKYRNAEPEDRHKFEVITKLRKLKTTSLVTFILMWGAIVACLYCGHNGISHPYSWSLAQNACYYSLARATFTFAVAVQLAIIFLGHLPVFTKGM